MNRLAIALMMSTTVTTVATTAASTAIAEPAGIRLTNIETPHQTVKVSMSIWYPNGGGGETMVFAENPVFQGVEVAKGAAARSSLSHWRVALRPALRDRLVSRVAPPSRPSA